jgi:hypothetical protein
VNLLHENLFLSSNKEGILYSQSLFNDDLALGHFFD